MIINHNHGSQSFCSPASIYPSISFHAGVSAFADLPFFLLPTAANISPSCHAMPSIPWMSSPQLRLLIIQNPLILLQLHRPHPHKHKSPQTSPSENPVTPSQNTPSPPPSPAPSVHSTSQKPSQTPHPARPRNAAAAPTQRVQRLHPGRSGHLLVLLPW